MKAGLNFFPLSVILALLSMPACQRAKEVKVEVTAPQTDTEMTYMVELPAADIFEKLDSKNFIVRNNKGEEITSQLTYDSLILFQATLKPGETKEFKIHPSDTLPKYKNLVWGTVYSKRRDDLSYENELGGYRIYGPGTQAAGEKSFGYDIFFKYPTEEMIVPQLYAPETDDEVWAKVDSLRQINDNLAEEFIKTFSYHLDHGKGMDSFAVGPTLGAGAPAIVLNDSVVYPWCYETTQILDNGPLRFSYELNFGTVELPEGDKIIEHRINYLDAGSYLNNSVVWYEGMTKPYTVATGFPLRDEISPIIENESSLLAYSAPAQQPEYGRALLGIILENGSDSVFNKDQHLLIATTLNPSDSLKYKWGFSWDKTEIATQEEWVKWIKTSGLKPFVKIK
ncbi:MAG: DUF4861 family protein [Muribaculaceae bacterium]|nr:DUF4861 family protein [Muribaculaceae bacterium]